MKRTRLFGATLTLIAAVTMIAPTHVRAQESESPFSVGGDLVSSYVWRGTKFGSGPAIQPYLEYSIGGFSVGGWGSYCFAVNEAAEADLYVSYGFDFGLSIGFTDYFFPTGSRYFDFTGSDGSHAYEVNLGYEIGGFSVGANMFLNATPDGAGTAGQDLYFELAYNFKHFGIFVGAGNGWHTVEEDADESDFNLVNIGITASKEIPITENYSLPVSGSLILNPDTEQFHVVVAVSF